jgi:hypothetical protein
LTDDLWFHLAAGEIYASDGPWPSRDPLLHTALPEAPVQHEWLFGVGVHVVDEILGLHGLRLLHMLAVIGLILGAGFLMLRNARSPALAALATTVFVALSWWRLAQLRPDLFSIGATLILYGVFFASPRMPSNARSGAIVALMVLWANVHSLFMVGFALGVAVLLGMALDALLARAAPEEFGAARRRARAARLASVLGLGALASLANPRGISQHLTFLDATRQTAIWQIRDEWVHFRPLSWPTSTRAENPVAWALTNALLLGFAASAAVNLLCFVRDRSADRLRRFDAEAFGLGLAAIVALFVSIRFRWLAFLPLLYVLRTLGHTRSLSGSAAEWRAAAMAFALALTFLRWGDVELWTNLLPRTPREYVERTHVAGKYHAEGVRFLSDARLEGNLFNHYWMGGYLGYWLAPRLRTFIDGRTEHYPPQVLAEANAISGRTGARPGDASYLDVLARRGVNVFFGVGIPPFGVGRNAGVYTADNLIDAGDWVLVFRAIDQAIYLLRADPRKNLERVARFYGERNVPFDPRRGFDPERVIREAPDFARLYRLLPEDDRELREAVAGGTPSSRVLAAELLASAEGAAGAWSSAVETARLALSLAPDSRPARRSLVYGLLRTGRFGEALEEAAALYRLDPLDARSGRILSIARRAAAREDLATLLLSYPLLDGDEKLALLAHFGSASLTKSSTGNIGWVR